MTPEDFLMKLAPGRLEPTTFTERRFSPKGIETTVAQGYGFVPDNLPPQISRSEILDVCVQPLLDAERSLSELAGVARDIDNPLVLMGPFIQREAKLSSAIENTFASGQNLALFDVDANAVEPDKRQDTREVSNYSRALWHGYKSDLPICRRLILDMHKILLDGVDRDAGTPGKFRQTQNAISQQHHRFRDAKFVPPPPRYLDKLISALEAYVNTKSSLPRLIQFALTHYQFETIHPFDDGNGRLGRLLIALQLCKQAQLDMPLVYISGFFEANREEYYQRLFRVSTQGECGEWINFFLTAIATQAEDARDRAKNLLGLRQKYRDLVTEKRASAMLPSVIDELFKQPAITVTGVCKTTGLKAPSAGKLIGKLEEKGIVLEITGRQRKRVYVATEILEATQS